MSRLQSMKDIADAAGVSIATVSRVLNNKPDVNERTRERVMQYVDASEYQHRAPRSPAADAGLRLIGFVNASRTYPITSDYVAGLVTGVNERCGNHAYNMVFVEADSIEKEIRWPGRYSIFEQLDGIIWSMPVFDETYRRFLEERKLPYVVINNLKRGIAAPLVESDNLTAARQAVEYLVGLGHTRIGFMGGELEIANMADRYHGYQQHMREFGLEIDRDWVVDDLAQVERQSAIEGTYRLIGRRNLPSALICATESISRGVYQVLHQRGIRIPDDISVLAYDDIPLTEFVNPPLTTFRQPLEHMAEHAVDTLMDLIHHPERVAEPPHIVEPLTLIVRGSVGEIVSPAGAGT